MKNMKLMLFSFLLSMSFLESKNCIFNKTEYPVALTFELDIPFSKKSKKSPVPNTIIPPLPKPFTVIPLPIEMHPLTTDYVKASLVCKKMDLVIGNLPCKKVKSVRIKTPKVTDLFDYELVIVNGKLQFNKLNTILGVKAK